MSEKLGYRAALISALSVVLTGCILYINAKSLFALFASQFVIGLGCGTLGVTRSYVTNSTTRASRTVQLARLTAVQYSAFSVMPIAGSALSWLGESRPLRIAHVGSLNEFTLPAAFLAVLTVGCMVLVWMALDDDGGQWGGGGTEEGHIYSPVITAASLEDKTAAEYKRPAQGQGLAWQFTAEMVAPNRTASQPTAAPALVDASEASESGESSPLPSAAFSRTETILLVGGCMCNAATKGTVGVYETLGSEYASSHFGWSGLQVGSIFAACGAAGICTLLSFGLLARAGLGEAQLMVVGVAMMTLSCLLLSGPSPGGPQFVTALALMLAVGYPLGHTALLGGYSKVLRRGKQGFVLGMFASAGSLARVVMPLLSSELTLRYVSEAGAFFLCACLLLLTMAALFYTRHAILEYTA
jgi:MFS family permease